ERSRGVIAASTGNHGQSVAYASRLFGVSAIICAPAAANPVKVEAMQDLGAEVILEGERYDDSRRNADRLSREHGYRYIHSGNEPDAGRGPRHCNPLRATAADPPQAPGRLHPCFR